MSSHFADRLVEAVKKKGTALVVGLDPVYSKLPQAIRKKTQSDDERYSSAEVNAILDYSKQVLQIAAPLVPAVKINIAFFEKYLWQGVEAYYSLVSEAKELDLEVIGDVKRGDIGHTAQSYAAAHLDKLEMAGLQDTVTPDAITINGYTGIDGIEPFADMANKNGRGLFVLVRTSNPSAAAIQDFADADGRKMYEKMAEAVGGIANRPEQIGTSGYSNIGMVVGGTAPKTTTELRKKYDRIWFLVPGYGSQGASAADCMRFCKADGMGALINASRSIIYAYEKPKYKEQFGDDWKKCVEQAIINAKADLANAIHASI